MTPGVPLGASIRWDGVQFGVWAPSARNVEVLIGDARHQLERGDDGVHTGVVPGMSAGALYQFSVDGAPGTPDPRSKYQPEGVHGPSEVIDLASFGWTDQEWPGLRNENLSIYELHVGTYTSEGTFEALIEQLPALRDLGVRIVELMPVADFPGRWNWGYDGVSLFAPSRAYGRPEDLQRLVDTAHALGLGVMLDVVYNHLGPDGNYLRVYSDGYFTDRHETPWGEAINYDGPGSRFVRDFVIDNAIQWVRDYHIDGLRLDASDTIQDESDPHILAELQEQVRASVDRDVVIVAEEAQNEVRTIQPRSRGGYGIDAVWADDFHHELRVILSNAWENYYADYAGTMEGLAKALNEGFIYQGQEGSSWGGPHGSKVTDEPANAFVIAIQNHDQVGNRPFGERLHHDINLDRYAVASALLLLAPETPLLFMGQEFSASTPFLYFTDHHEELGRLVTQGRRKEFAGFRAFGDDAARALIPDPQAESTFLASKLRLDEREQHAGIYALYKRLLHTRHTDPVFVNQDRSRSRATPLGAHTIALHRWLGDQHRLLIANFGSEMEVRMDRVESLRDIRIEKLRPVLSTGEAMWEGQAAIKASVSWPELHVPARMAVLLANGQSPG
jgi:maltooligosyltrehalose trehalohydrolase